MISSRASTVLRSTRVIRPVRLSKPTARFQSTNPTPSSSSGGSNGALIGGIAGGSAALIGVYAWYHFSGAKTLVNTAHETKAYFTSAQKKLTENAPAPNEALKWLRQVTTYYAGFIPGASSVVDSALNDLDKVHDKHRDEVDKIIHDAYDELKKISNQGVSAAAAAQAWEVLQKHMSRLGELAGDAAQDILENHPELKKQVGGNLDKLKKLGEQYGPDAKKQVDETWEEVKKITKSDGASTATIDKVKKLVEEKIAELQKLSDGAWDKVMEKAKPLLEKNPKIKEIVEGNADALKQGDFSQIYDNIKKAVDSGNTEDLEKFVKGNLKKAKDATGGGFEELLKKIPGADQFLPKIQSLQEIAEKHGGEAKKLLDETVDELTQVLSKKADKAKELARDAESKASK